MSIAFVYLEVRYGEAVALLKRFKFSLSFADIVAREGENHMPHITKSTLSFGTTALSVAEKALPPYSHPKSPHTYTQPQLFAILALRTFLKQDYRGIAALLSEWAELRQALKLKKVPNYSALWYAEQRLIKKGLFTSSLRVA